MTALTILRNDLRRHRPVLKWQVMTMIAMFVMLCVALALTTSSAGPDAGSSEVLFIDNSKLRKEVRTDEILATGRCLFALPGNSRIHC